MPKSPSHHTFRQPRSTRGQQILIARKVTVNRATEAARRKAAGKSCLMQHRRRGYQRGGSR